MLKTNNSEILTNTTDKNLLVFPNINNNLIYYFVPIYTILFLIGTFGNGLVIISIIRSSRLRTVTNTYLLNIAVADFVLLLSVPFLIVTILAEGWIFGNVLCKMYYNFIHINQYVSSLLLAALSFDRYLAVCHPIRAIEFRTRTKCVLIIAGCWLISVFFLGPTWVFATVTSERFVFWLGYRVQKCVIDFPSIIFTIPPEIVFTYYAFFLGFLFPVSMITTFYILVLVRLNRIRRKHKSELKQRSHRKVTRIVLAVITAYFICWVPYWFLQIFITIDPLIDSLRLNFSILPANTSMRFLRELTHLTTIIGYANNCLNPVLYVFLSESFREEYLIVLKCFHPCGFFTDSDSNDDNIIQNSYERDLGDRSSGAIVERREKSMKKIKHSVAIDEIPSNFQSLSLCFHRNNDRKSRSSSTSFLPKEHDEHLCMPHRKVSVTSRRIKTEQKKQLMMVKLTLNPRLSSPRILDDGGVYCGEDTYTKQLPVN
ncbi:unnamed protein product [Adineta ricciae]|uniref:G-protein coupled receptors family 1 profile domain-containing protein n=1 Tax=Adineta ricciae TaxID=249248 RepID=A0A814PXJ7_ADIRI|nr:unnamed protein product [Adineta ricciae]CAF1478669.1 unnamed protein product [Adineta ricciae]